MSSNRSPVENCQPRPETPDEDSTLCGGVPVGILPRVALPVRVWAPAVVRFLIWAANGYKSSGNDEAAGALEEAALVVKLSADLDAKLYAPGLREQCEAVFRDAQAHTDEEIAEANDDLMALDRIEARGYAVVPRPVDPRAVVVPRDLYDRLVRCLGVVSGRVTIASETLADAGAVAEQLPRLTGAILDELEAAAQGVAA